MDGRCSRSWLIGANDRFSGDQTAVVNHSLAFHRWSGGDQHQGAAAAKQATSRLALLSRTDSDVRFESN